MCCAAGVCLRRSLCVPQCGGFLLLSPRTRSSSTASASSSPAGLELTLGGFHLWKLEVCVHVSADRVHGCPSSSARHCSQALVGEAVTRPVNNRWASWDRSRAPRGANCPPPPVRTSIGQPVPTPLLFPPAVPPQSQGTPPPVCADHPWGSCRPLPPDGAVFPVLCPVTSTSSVSCTVLQAHAWEAP